MNINLIYEVNNREFNNCVLLERELARRGHKVRIYNKTEDMIISGKDCVTIIPNSYRTEDVLHYRYTFNTKNNLMIVNPCEQVTNHRMPNFFDYSNNNQVKKLPHLCWGNDYYSWIKSLGFDSEDSAITGAIQLDFCREDFSDLYKTKSELAEKYNLPLDKKWILFISDFVYDSETIVNQIISSGDLDEKIIREKNKLEKETLLILLDWFRKFLNEQEDYILIYRKHPVEMLIDPIEKMQKDYPDKFFAISELNIKEWIFNCEKIASWYSTSVIECFAANKKMALLRPVEFSDESKMRDYSFYRDYNKIDTYELFEKAMITDIAEYTEGTKQEIEKLYKIDNVPAFSRIAEEIEKIEKNWEKDRLEKRYFVKKWRYLLKENIPLKIIIKKLYQFIYKTFGLKSSKQGEQKTAINEWIASVENKKNYKELAEKIDQILDKYYPLEEESKCSN